MDCELNAIVITSEKEVQVAFESLDAYEKWFEENCFPASPVINAATEKKQELRASVVTAMQVDSRKSPMSIVCAKLVKSAFDALADTNVQKDIQVKRDAVILQVLMHARGPTADERPAKRARLGPSHGEAAPADD